MKEYEFDESKATHYEGEESKQMLQHMFMVAADDAPTIEEAVHRLSQGRPRLGQPSKESKGINTRFTDDWIAILDSISKSVGQTRSQLIRNAVYQVYIQPSQQH
ncbi:hypothetical protein GCM10007377_15210 [Galliscardovia ingluviei]|uniref:Ribbon-helix-helix protein CopG domain-containing protein n=1 Tax=Galliscardovia ingluviei TaxID=1769422 RepID=A0A8J3AM61_9BIFI|nr:hypothetical protein [Galliscardovia ingluviei]GGI15300.1 hypothetical protein GCM10007377_15210 [Galliscardovia ingluviei]